MSSKRAGLVRSVGVYVSVIVALLVASGSVSAITHADAGTPFGDRRDVGEPRLPIVTCATVTPAFDGNFTDEVERAAPDAGPIQQVLDRCGGGPVPVAVKLTSAEGRSAFLTGPLTVHANEVLVVDAGVTLLATRDPAQYQEPGKPKCGTISEHGGGCRALIEVSGAGSGVEGVAGPDGRLGVIDGRGGEAILGSDTTWWQLAREADGRGTQNNPRLIQIDNSDDVTLYHVELRNAANFHVVYQGGHGFTVWGIRIVTPADARNTDGIDPGNGARDVTIAESDIQDGDDGIAIKGDTATGNITVRDNIFRGTHGISVGSETRGGVDHVLVERNTVYGTDANGTASTLNNGLRIKGSGRNGGAVTDVLYRDTTTIGVAEPLVLDTHYSSGGDGPSIPWYTGVTVDGLEVRDTPRGAKVVLDGYDSAHRLEVTLRNITAGGIPCQAKHADIHLDHSDLMPAGEDVTTGD